MSFPHTSEIAQESNGYTPNVDTGHEVGNARIVGDERFAGEHYS